MSKQADEWIVTLESQNQMLQEMIRCLQLDLAEEERKVAVRYL